VGGEKKKGGGGGGGGWGGGGGVGGEPTSRKLPGKASISKGEGDRCAEREDRFLPSKSSAAIIRGTERAKKKGSCDE